MTEDEIEVSLLKGKPFSFYKDYVVSIFEKLLSSGDEEIFCAARQNGASTYDIALKAAKVSLSEARKLYIKIEGKEP